MRRSMGERGVRRCVRSQDWVARRYAQNKETAVVVVGLRRDLQVVNCGAWGAVRRKLELVGSTRGACPEMSESR